MLRIPQDDANLYFITQTAFSHTARGNGCVCAQAPITAQRSNSDLLHSERWA